MMNRQENNQNNRTEQQLRILIDRKHGTYYCIDQNGKSYIKNNQTLKGGKRI